MQVKQMIETYSRLKIVAVAAQNIKFASFDTFIADMSVAKCLSDVEWDEEDYYLHDFTRKFKLPQIAKITKGQYLNLGVSSVINSSLSSTVLLDQVSKRLKIAAQCVKFKDGNRVVPIGTKLAIPDNYEGWFEILSEEGRAVRSIESVSELIKIFPETCLIRENIKAHLAKKNNAETISDKTRIVCAGETLVLVSEVHVTPVKSKSSGRYLRCLTTKDETVFLSADQKGKFSPIASQDSISGVHTVKNLLSKRFPLMVRLVHGKPPIGIKNNSHFVTEMRLYSLFEEESIMALPLLKDSQLVALPLSAPLKVQALKDSESLLKSKNIDSLIEKCNILVEDMSNKIQIFDISLSKELRTENFLLKKRLKYIFQENRIKSNESNLDPKCKIIFDTEKSLKDNESPKKPEASDPAYDDIDQIYNYIRGTVPFPTKVVDKGNEQSSKPNSMIIGSAVVADCPDSSNTKPEPPPIETIPVRQVPKEESHCIGNSVKDESPPQDCNINQECKDFHKDTWHIYEKLEMKRDHFKKTPKNSKNNHTKLFLSHPVNHGMNKFLMQSPAQLRIYHKSKPFKQSPSLKEVSIHHQRKPRNKCFITSSIFNLRYKSLINLAVDSDDTNKSEGKISDKNCGNLLRRPKSLEDMFGRADHFCPDRNIDTTSGTRNWKLLFFLTQESGKGKLLNRQQTKHIGTLYL